MRLVANSQRPKIQLARRAKAACGSMHYGRNWIVQITKTGRGERECTEANTVELRCQETFIHLHFQEAGEQIMWRCQTQPLYSETFGDGSMKNDSMSTNKNVIMNNILIRFSNFNYRNIIIILCSLLGLMEDFRHHMFIFSFIFFSAKKILMHYSMRLI